MKNIVDLHVDKYNYYYLFLTKKKINCAFMKILIIIVYGTN